MLLVRVLEKWYYGDNSFHHLRESGEYKEPTQQDWGDLKEQGELKEEPHNSGKANRGDGEDMGCVELVLLERGWASWESVS